MIDPAELEFPEDDVLPIRSDPVIINENQWAEEYCGFYEKQSLEYYPEDDILLTEDGELVDRRALIVGTEWEKDVAHGESEMYVRNASYGTDFQIVVRQGLGIDHVNPDF